MSYDLRLGVKIADTDRIAVVDEPEYSSPTYNLREMFVACMDWDYHQGEWYKVADVWDKINNGISELHKNPKKYRAMEPDNGWGTVSSAILALESLRDCIEKRSDEYWYGDTAIPIEYLWMRW